MTLAVDHEPLRFIDLLFGGAGRSHASQLSEHAFVRPRRSCLAAIVVIRSYLVLTCRALNRGNAEAPTQAAVLELAAMRGPGSWQLLGVFMDDGIPARPRCAAGPSGV